MNWKINRRDDNCCLIENDLSIDVKLFANKDVEVENEAFDELFSFLDVERAVRDIHSQPNDFLDSGAKISRTVLTPDFHKGAGVPVGTVSEVYGFVIPKAIGNDICCGMRLLATDLPTEKLESHWVEIQKRLRAIFFEGQRNIPMSPKQREAVLRDGLPGLLANIKDNEGNGIYRFYDPRTQALDLNRLHNHGGFPTKRLFGFEKFIESSGEIDGRDPQIGCVGGGNHFCELQRIDDILCKVSAKEMNLQQGNLAIMIHSGSVALGHIVGGYFMDRARQLFPKGIKHPKNDFFILPTSGKLQDEGSFYLDSMRNAANFAFANRLFLGLMTVRAIQETIGIDIDTHLIYDAPHNLIFQKDNRYIHRKGATPAEGPEKVSDWMGHPVIIPGSMGSASYLLTGMGNDEALESACHGAGRIMPRGEAAHVSNEIFEKETEHLRIVGPVDPKSPQMLMRRDILQKYWSRVKEEAPYAYKPITPVIKSIEAAGIARPVAKLMPLCTVKG